MTADPEGGGGRWKAGLRTNQKTTESEDIARNAAAGHLRKAREKKRAKKRKNRRKAQIKKSARTKHELVDAILHALLAHTPDKFFRAQPLYILETDAHEIKKSLAHSL